MGKKIDTDKVRWQAARDQFDAAIKANDDDGYWKANERMWDVPNSLTYQAEYLNKKDPDKK